VSDPAPDPYPPRPEPRGSTDLAVTARRLATDRRVGIGLLVAVAAVAGFLWYRAGRAQASLAPPPVTRSARRTREVPTTTTTRPPVLVHVAGAVAHPGLVRLAAGDRVDDAVRAAGGPAPNADLDRLNLAAKVADGQRILVVLVGAPAGAEVAAPAGAATAPAAAGASSTGPVNLNTATVEQLDRLPGIGPALAAAILRERERRGGFTDVGQLRDVRGIGEGRFADLKPLVTV
jgi:competence protein ComEA